MNFHFFRFLVCAFPDSHVILRGFRTFSIAPEGAKWHMSRVFEDPRARIPLPKTYSREQRSKTLHITRVFHVPNRENLRFARGMAKKIGQRRPKGSDIDRPPEGIRTSTHTHTHTHAHTHAHTHTYTRTRTCTHTHASTCINTHTYIHTYIHTCTHPYI